eukprot:5509596-Pyramimonas_sp.AAC.1
MDGNSLAGRDAKQLSTSMTTHTHTPCPPEWSCQSPSRGRRPDLGCACIAARGAARGGGQEYQTYGNIIPRCVPCRRRS